MTDTASIPLSKLTAWDGYDEGARDLGAAIKKLGRGG